MMSLSSLAATPENTIEIGIAATPEEKREIYRLRYRIYIEEMDMQLTSADHVNSLLSDELDEWGILLYAKAGEEYIGTLRVNIGTVENFSQDLTKRLSLERFKKFYTDGKSPYFAYSSKLMVTQQYRNSTAFYLLMAKGYETYYNYGVQFNFGICNFHLPRLYEQFGWRRFGQSFTAPGYDGVLIPVVLLVDDIQHMRAVRSPFYRQARNRGQLSDRAASWFYEEFPECLADVNNQLTSEAELWAMLQDRLGRRPEAAIPILDGVNVEDAKKFVHGCGLIMSFRAGDPIVGRGFESHTVNILLAGGVKSPGAAGLGISSVLPGQCFGTAGLAGSAQCTQDFIAATAAEVLVLSRLGFAKFQHNHPAAAGRILHNLAAWTRSTFRRFRDGAAAGRANPLRDNAAKTPLYAKRTWRSGV